MGTASKWAVN